MQESSFRVVWPLHEFGLSEANSAVGGDSYEFGHTLQHEEADNGTVEDRGFSYA